MALYALTKIDLSFKISDFGVMQNIRKQWGYDTDEKTSTHPIAHSGIFLSFLMVVEHT